MISLTDGTTACAWDVVIPFAPLWEQYRRVIKPHGAIVLFGSQPFTTDLIQSNREWFRYEIVWSKTLFSNPLLANKQPMKTHENIVVFSDKQTAYYPQMWAGIPYKDKPRPGDLRIQGNEGRQKLAIDNKGTRYPQSVIDCPNPNNGNEHPTQKPVALCSYLIRTYTLPGETVLDNTMGSGSTLVACVETERNGIGIEKDESYFAIAEKRIHAVARRLAESPALPL